MAWYRIDAAQVRDVTTGELRSELVGQQVAIVTRDTNTPFPIYNSIHDPIPDSRVRVSALFTVPSIHINVDAPADLYLDWLDSSGARGPVEFEAVLRDAAKVAAADAAAARADAQTARAAAQAAEAAVAAAPIAIPPGGAKGTVVSKASGSDRDVEWRDVDGPIAAAAQVAASASQKGTQAIDAVNALEERVGDLEEAGPGPGGGVTVDQIEGATTVGKAVLKASSKANARSAIDAASVEDMAGKAPAENRPPIYLNPTVPVPDGAIVGRFVI